MGDLDSPGQQPEVGVRSPRTLAGPVLRFDLAAEMKELRQEEAWRVRGHNAKTLAKFSDLRIVLIVMKPGARLQEHKTGERISVQTLNGRVRLHLPDQVVDLPAGALLALDRSVPHDVEALEESAFLLSIAWTKETR